MTSPSYEVCLVTSSIRGAVSVLRQMLTPLEDLHYKTFECVEIHYSGERDALLLRLMFSEVFSTQSGQERLVQSLRDRGFDVLESSELSEQEKPRFEQLLREQYQVRLQQYPALDLPSAASRILDSLQAHVEPVVLSSQPASQVTTSAPKPVERMSTVDAFDLVISELPMLEVDVPGSLGEVDVREVIRDEDKAMMFANPETGAEGLPLRMETFGALDDMIATLPRAKTQESLDMVLDNLWS